MSAVVLRELVAKLGLQVDEAAYQKADKGLKTIKDDLVGLDRSASEAGGHFKKATQAMAADTGKAVAALEKKPKGGGISGELLKYFGGAAIAAGIAEVVKLASDTVETGNVLQEVFGPEGKTQVEAWSSTMSEKLGRSKYALQANTAALGAMIQPMVGSSAKAQEMSTSFAGLAVDLASFFNSSDDEALGALKSAIAGQAEPLRRYGVILEEKTLQEYAHAKGIKQKYNAMTVAAQTELRYAFIMDKTKKAQGDAERTAKEFANSARALTDHIKDLAIGIGLKLLPAAKKLVIWANTAIGSLGELAEHSKLIEASLLTLGVILLSTFGPAIASAALAAAGFAAVALVVDDLITLFTGGESSIGAFLDTLGGEGTAEAFVKAMGEAMAWLKQQWDELVAKLTAYDWDHAIAITSSNLRALGIVLKEVFEAAFPYIQKVAKVIGWLAEKLPDIIGSIATAAADNSAIWQAIKNKIAAAQRDALYENPSEHTKRRNARLNNEAAAAAAGASPPTTAAPPISAAPGTLTVPGPSAATGGRTNVYNFAAPVINVAPGTTPSEAAKAAAKSAMLERRRLQYALGSSTPGKAFG